MTYRDPAEKPAPAPLTIEERIAADVRELCGEAPNEAGEIVYYVRARLFAHRKGYGPLRLWLQWILSEPPGRDIREQEATWRQRREEHENREALEHTLALVKRHTLALVKRQGEDEP